MVLENFLGIPEQSRDRVQVLSVQTNEYDRYDEWENFCEAEEALNRNRIFFPFHEVGFAKENPYHSSMEWCNQFWNEIGTNPFVGLIAIRMILLFPIRSLNIVGFDFFKETVGEIRKKIGCHHVARQIEWLLHKYNTDFRITVDKRLEEIFSAVGKINRGNLGTFNTADEAGA